MLLSKEETIMKVRPSVKPICEKCKIIKRHGKVMVICQNPKHKQKQGCATRNYLLRAYALLWKAELRLLICKPKSFNMPCAEV